MVRWNESIDVLIQEALKPAEIASLELDYDEMTANVYVTEDQQLPLAVVDKMSVWPRS